MISIIKLDVNVTSTGPLVLGKLVVINSRCWASFGYPCKALHTILDWYTLTDWQSGISQPMQRAPCSRVTISSKVMTEFLQSYACMNVLL